MAYYISSNIPIKGYQKAFNQLRGELYQNVSIDTHLQAELSHENPGTKVIEAFIIAFLLRKSKFKGVGYYAILDAIANTHIQNYKRIFVKNNPKSDLKYLWQKEFKDIQSSIALDITLNQDWHQKNIEYIKDNTYKRIASLIAGVYVVNKSVDFVQAKLKNKSWQNQSVLSSTNKFITPDENMRLYDIIRTGKIKKAEYPVALSTIEGRWNYHQWQTYSHSDFPCYSVDGEIRKAGEKFSNGFYSPKCHPGCLCSLTPTQ